MSATRDTKVSIHVSELEKKQIEAVATVYDCSQAAAGRMLFSSAYEDIFGSIHPDALERHDVDVDALVRGDLDPEEVNDELKMDRDGTPKVPSADGGLASAVEPSSHSPTQTPQDLAENGPALSWEELREVVNRHWDDELRIHPGRVGTEVLKQKPEISSKVLAAMLRCEEDVIVDDLIETRIEEYLSHHIDSHDYESALQYRITTYKPKIIEHLEAHPGTRTDLHYASTDAVERDLPNFVTNTLESLQENQDVLDYDKWADEDDLLETELWLEALADFRHDLLDLGRVYKDPTFIQALIDSDIDYPEESYDDAIQWLKAVCESWLDQYTEVDPLARYAAVHTVHETDPELLETEIDRAAEAISAFNDGEAPAQTQFAKIRGRVS